MREGRDSGMNGAPNVYCGVALWIDFKHCWPAEENIGREGLLAVVLNFRGYAFLPNDYCNALWEWKYVSAGQVFVYLCWLRVGCQCDLGVWLHRGE